VRVTVCELNDSAEEFLCDWERLAAHVGEERSDLVLLPEMPFFPWLFWKRHFDAILWEKSVEAHHLWLERLEELAPACVLGTLPENSGGKRLNRGFFWEKGTGCRLVHSKYYLPDEEGYWEATWYSRGDGRFETTLYGDTLFGFLICTDIWFFQHSRHYGKQGAHLVVCPRATPGTTRNKWLVAGQAAAVVAGAFCLSSNRVAPEGNPADLGGTGWLIAPDGGVLGLTSPEKPFLTMDIDLNVAVKAKHMYPRYVEE
jgi:N-carbamoylputrescine amidase